MQDKGDGVGFEEVFERKVYRGATPLVYAVYKGDEFVTVGTAKECANDLGITTKTFHEMKSAAKRRVKSKKKKSHMINVKPYEFYILEDDEGS